MKPILLSTEMVRAILDGRKTVTRRKIKPQLMEFKNNKTEQWDSISHYGDSTFEFKCRNFTSFYPSPYLAGDILYVRETWMRTSSFGLQNGFLHKANKKQNAVIFDNTTEKPKWRPSIHMPKEAARIFLKVKNVKAERLQNVCVADCVREGADTGTSWVIDAKPNFIKLWNSTVKKADLDRYGWDANPWVWVIGFKRISKEEVYG